MRFSTIAAVAAALGSAAFVEAAAKPTDITSALILTASDATAVLKDIADLPGSEITFFTDLNKVMGDIPTLILLVAAVPPKLGDTTKLLGAADDLCKSLNELKINAVKKISTLGGEAGVLLGGALNTLFSTINTSLVKPFITILNNNLPDSAQLQAATTCLNNLSKPIAAK